MNPYDRISTAISYLCEHREQQPPLEKVAAYCGLSATHFQRLFSQWVGVSPKRFLQILTVEQAKERLRLAPSLLHLSDDLGLSSSSRLHDHFITLEAASPGEWRSGGEGMELRWDTTSSPFGGVFVAMTQRGICQLGLLDNNNDPDTELQRLRWQWPKAEIANTAGLAQGLITQWFSDGKSIKKPLSLHVKGTNFQVQVWRLLMTIQPCDFTSYGTIARQLGKPGAARAVGSAVGSNPVALLIPCHRVIRQSGEMGGYHWGLARKRSILAWEQAKTETSNLSYDMTLNRRKNV